MMMPRALLSVFVVCGLFLGSAAILPAQELSEIESEAASEMASEAPSVEIEADPVDVKSKSFPTETVKKGPLDMSKRITLDLRNMDVSDALKYLSLRSGMNIVTSRAVTGQVTFQLKDVPLQDILDITLLSNNLAYDKIGEIYYIMPAKEYETRYGREFSDARQVKMLHLRYAIPEKAFDVLDTLKSKVGRVLVDQESGTVLIMDTSEKIAQMEEALTVLEKKNDVRVFNLQYASAREVADKLKLQLDDKRLGSIQADERSNQVIVQTLPERMEEIIRLINALDKKTKEVLIDAKILKITLTDDMTVGFDWEGMFKNMVKGGATHFIGSHPLEPVVRAGQSFIDDFTNIRPEDTNTPPGNKSTFSERIFFGATSSNYAFEVLLNFLQTIGDTRLLSNPKLAVINNQEARIHIGRKEAYITTTTTTGQTTTTTAEEVTFVDVGIQLAVTPTINDDGFITMKIKPEVSSVVSTLITPSGNQIPIIDTSLAETTVMVKDNSTIIIGGLRRDDEVKTIEQVPFLGNIPLLGKLFGSRTTRKQRSELMVMLTPHVIEGDILEAGDDFKDRTKPYRDYGRVEPPPDEAAGERFVERQLAAEAPEIDGLELKPYRN